MAVAAVERERAAGRLRGPAPKHRAARTCSASSTRGHVPARFFAGLGSQNRYAIIYRLHDAKRPETRARRLAKFVAMLEAGETIHP